MPNSRYELGHFPYPDKNASPDAAASIYWKWFADALAQRLYKAALESGCTKAELLREPTAAGLCRTCAEVCGRPLSEAEVAHLHQAPVSLEWLDGILTDLDFLAVEANAKEMRKNAGSKNEGSTAGTVAIAKSACYERLASTEDAALGGAPVLLAVWLTANDRERLLARCPAAYGNVHADHVTLQFCPADDLLPSADLIGQLVELHVQDVELDESVQAAPMGISDSLRALCANKIPHVTISVAQGGSAVQSNALLEARLSTKPATGADTCDLTLCGRVGIAVETRSPAEDPFVDPEVRSMVESLLEKREPGSSMAMPTSLTSQQRAALHTFAAQNGLKSKSEGKGADRFIKLSVPAEGDASKPRVFTASAALIVDPDTYAAWRAARATTKP